MGVNLQYRGSQPDPRLRIAAVEAAVVFAREMEWGANPLRLERPRGFLGHHVLEHPVVDGLMLLPHFACEPLPLLFLETSGTLLDSYLQDEGDNDVRFNDAPLVKTQFAGARVHTEICECLRELRQRFVPDLEVDDETGFFASGDSAALAHAFEAGWESISRSVNESALEPGQRFAIGGFQFERPPEGGTAPADEFAGVAAEHRQLLESQETFLMTRYGGFGFNLDHSRESLADLDLLMSEADDNNWRERLDDPDVEGFVHAVGAYFGRTVARLLGGAWELDPEEGLCLANIGGIGLRASPFQAAADRLVEGPPHNLGHHFQVYEDFARHLRIGDQGT